MLPSRVILLIKISKLVPDAAMALSPPCLTCDLACLSWPVPCFGNGYSNGFVMVIIQLFFAHLCISL